MGTGSIWLQSSPHGGYTVPVFDPVSDREEIARSMPSRSEYWPLSSSRWMRRPERLNPAGQWS